MVESAEWQNTEWNPPANHRRGTAVDRAVAAAGHQRLAPGFDRTPHRRVELASSRGQGDACFAPCLSEDLLQPLGGFGSRAITGSGVEDNGDMPPAHLDRLRRRWRASRSPKATAVTQMMPIV